jgi:hypothetical protein
VGRPPANSYPHVQVADAAVATMRGQWLALLTELGDRFDVDAAAHLAAFTTPAITASATAPELVAKRLPSLAGLTATLADVASRAARRLLGAPPLRPAAGFAGSFNLVNDQAVVWARQRAGELVAAVDDQTRQAVAALVVRGQQGDLSAQDIARQIKPLIGLSAPQATAAMNYRDALVTRQLQARYGQDAAGTVRGQWALSPWRGGALDEDRIDRLTQQYADRQRAWRAEMIARTESIAAANQGDMLAWDETIRTGGADGYTITRTWSVTDDDRACPECLSLDGEVLESDPVSETRRPSVASMGSFTGGIDAPPAHQSCRCTILTTLE